MAKQTKTITMLLVVAAAAIVIWYIFRRPSTKCNGVCQANNDCNYPNGICNRDKNNNCSCVCNSGYSGQNCDTSPYTIYKDKTAVGYNLQYMDGTISQLMEACNTNNQCVGFTSDGLLKVFIPDLSYLTPSSADLYIKNFNVPQGYASYKGKDAGDNYNVVGGDVAYLAQQCNSDDQCQGFNTEGVLKNAIPDPAYFNSSQGDLYVKTFGIPQGYTLYKEKDGGSLYSATGGDIKYLTQQCNSASECQGFNTDGMLKSNVNLSNLVPSHGDLYVKNQ